MQNKYDLGSEYSILKLYIILYNIYNEKSKKILH